MAYITDHSIVCIVCGTRRAAHVARAASLWLAWPGLRGPLRSYEDDPAWAPFRGTDRAAHSTLPPPQTPRAPCARAHRSGRPAWPCSPPAHRLGGLHVLGRLGEEQLRVLRARKIQPTGSAVAEPATATIADLIEYLPDVWLLQRVRYRSGRLEPRCARPADGGIAPTDIGAITLSLAGPSCRHAIFSPVCGPMPCK